MGTNPAGGLWPESAGNFIFSMRQYTKQPMPIHDLANLLIARNLVADYDKLLHALRTVGYFRLTGYLYPFRLPNSDDYQHGTTLEKLWTIYTLLKEADPFILKGMGVPSDWQKLSLWQ